MADLPEAIAYPEGIYRLETTDPVLGGAVNPATKAGIANYQAQLLGNRTAWLKNAVAELAAQVIPATLLERGLVQLENSITSTSTTKAATADAVRRAAELAGQGVGIARKVLTTGLATGGGNLSTDRTIDVPAASKEQAEAGIDTVTAMTPFRTKQAIAALVPVGTVFRAGVVQLSEALDSTAVDQAATPNAVRRVLDNVGTRAAQTITIATSGLATGGGNLTADRTIDVPVASQAEAEAQTSRSNTVALTPARLQNALLVRSVTGAGLAAGGGNLGADRTIDVAAATQAEAEAGAINTRAMTPLRTRQLIVALANPNQQFDRTPYVSGEQTIVAEGNITLAHGLGVRPSLFYAVLRCKVAENGFLAGDEVLVTDSASDNFGVSLFTRGTTEIRAAFGSNVPLNYPTGSAGYATPANWRLVVRAYA